MNGGAREPGNMAAPYRVPETKNCAPSCCGNNTGRGWNMTTNIYSASGIIEVQRNCFGFMFTNVGDVIAELNGMVVFPSATPLTALGDSRTVSAHWLDMYKGNIRLSFRQPTAGVNPAVEIVQLFYIEGDFNINPL